MSLKQQALHLAPSGLLLRLNPVAWKLRGCTGRQLSLQRGEFDSGRSGDERRPHRDSGVGPDTVARVPSAEVALQHMLLTRTFAAVVNGVRSWRA
jgi:hypothetical protein